MLITELKIKNLSLAQEARIIRRYERAVLRKARWAKSNQGHEAESSLSYAEQQRLHLHRTGPVRRAARASQLALALLGGTSYQTVETPATNPRRVGQNPLPFDQVVKNLTTFGGMSKTDAQSRLTEWLSA